MAKRETPSQRRRRKHREYADSRDSWFASLPPEVQVCWKCGEYRWDRLECEHMSHGRAMSPRAVCDPRVFVLLCRVCHREITGWSQKDALLLCFRLKRNFDPYRYDRFGVLSLYGLANTYLEESELGSGEEFRATLKRWKLGDYSPD